MAPSPSSWRTAPSPSAPRSPASSTSPPCEQGLFSRFGAVVRPRSGSTAPKPHEWLELEFGSRWQSSRWFEVAADHAFADCLHLHPLVHSRLLDEVEGVGFLHPVGVHEHALGPVERAARLD